MTIQKFIKQHRQEIDRYIQQRVLGIRINDKERRLWILNDAGLYLWARTEGVEV